MSEPQTTPLWRYAYQMDLADWTASERLATQMFGNARKIFIAVYVAAALAGGMTADEFSTLLPEWLDDKVAVVASALVAGTLAYGASHAGLLFLAKWRAARRPLGDPVAVDIFGDHLAITRNTQTTFVPWEMMIHVHHTPEHVVLFPHGEKPLLLPRRVFDGPEDMRAFYTWAEAKGRDDD